MFYDVKVKLLSYSVLSNSLKPHGLQPARLLCPWDSPGKSNGVGCHSLLQGIFLTQESNPGIPHCRADSLPSEPPDICLSPLLQDAITKEDIAVTKSSSPALEMIRVYRDVAHLHCGSKQGHRENCKQFISFSCQAESSNIA